MSTFPKSTRIVAESGHDLLHGAVELTSDNAMAIHLDEPHAIRPNHGGLIITRALNVHEYPPDSGRFCDLWGTEWRIRKEE